jgi:alpha/beta superfamily hydrolase
VARRIESHEIAGPAGRLEALLEEPGEGQPLLAVLVCHPHPAYGGTMHNKVVHRLARGLRRAGAVALRFNFRGVGRSAGKHGNFLGEIEDARAALAWLRGRYPDLPFALAGFSFGARVIAHLACGMEGARWLLAAGFPTRYDDQGVLASCRVPRFFIQSTHDIYGPRGELEALVASLPEPKRLEWIEARDHFFAGGLDALEETVRRMAAGGVPTDGVPAGAAGFGPPSMPS